MTAFQLDQAVTIIGLDHGGETEYLGEQGVIAMGEPDKHGDWLVNFGDLRYSWFPADSLEIAATHAPGSIRIITGSVLFLGFAGNANNSPLTAPILLALALSALLATWGAARNQHGPLLALAGRWWAGRTGVQARRRHVYLRAGGR